LSRDGCWRGSNAGGGFGGWYSWPDLGSDFASSRLRFSAVLSFDSLFLHFSMHSFSPGPPGHSLWHFTASTESFMALPTVDSRMVAHPASIGNHTARATRIFSVETPRTCLESIGNTGAISRRRFRLWSRAWRFCRRCINRMSPLFSRPILSTVSYLSKAGMQDCVSLHLSGADLVIEHVIPRSEIPRSAGKQSPYSRTRRLL